MPLYHHIKDLVNYDARSRQYHIPTVASSTGYIDMLEWWKWFDIQKIKKLKINLTTKSLILLPNH